jgi:hypothetical protein
LYNQLLQSLRLQSEQFSEAILEIEKLISNHQYRQVFLIMSDLKEQRLWILSDDEKNLEKFWWEYAN